MSAHSDEPPEGWDDEAADILEQRAPDPGRLLLRGMVTGAWLDGQQFPPLRWHLHGVIPEGATLLVGPPKVGKSWLVLGLALGVAAGGRAMGVPVEQRPVLYLALEDSYRRLQQRARMLSMGEPLPAALHLMTGLAHAGTLLETVEAWMDTQAGRAPLVILDTLGKVKPQQKAGESAYGQDYRVAGQLKRLADDQPGSALVIVHHTRKAGAADFVDSASGTHGVAGACDTIVALERTRHEDTAVLHVTGRDVDEVEVAIERSGAAWVLTGGDLMAARAAATAARLSDGTGDDMAQLVAMVASTPEGMSAMDLAQALGWNAQRIRTYANRAVDAGRLVRAGRGRYALPGDGPAEGGPSVSSVSSAPLPGLSDDTVTTQGVSSVSSAGLRLVTEAFPGVSEVPADWT